MTLSEYLVLVVTRVMAITRRNGVRMGCTLLIFCTVLLRGIRIILLLDRVLVWLLLLRLLGLLVPRLLGRLFCVRFGNRFLLVCRWWYRIWLNPTCVLMRTGCYSIAGFSLGAWVDVGLRTGTTVWIVVWMAESLVNFLKLCSLAMLLMVRLIGPRLYLKWSGGLRLTFCMSRVC